MSYGNDNLMFIRSCTALSIDGTSRNIILDKDTKALSLYSTVDCWVEISHNPTATVGEKSFFIPAGWGPDVPVPAGTDAKPLIIAAIQATEPGEIYIYQRKD